MVKKSKIKSPKSAAKAKPKAKSAVKSATKKAKKRAKATPMAVLKLKSAPKPKLKSKPKSQVKAKPKIKSKIKAGVKKPPKPKPKPKLDESGKFMNVRQLRYFKQKLLDWRAEIVAESSQTLESLQQENLNTPDLNDRATSESDRILELKATGRQRKLIDKIDAALARIENKTYGYCEETGEPISLKRLDARPIATLSIEAQERHELREKTYRED